MSEEIKDVYTPEQFLKGIDSFIQECKNEKQWYLDYRFGSGVTPIITEFCKKYDVVIRRFELIKKYFVLVKGITLQQEGKEE